MANCAESTDAADDNDKPQSDHRLVSGSVDLKSMHSASPSLCHRSRSPKRNNRASRTSVSESMACCYN
ncbi:hypothetical protein RRG08_012401 [Elysia crispata]|uniref:Uncharacterized protein n=1 Tax=Elysia crispata TaxID=231223 RepID=A0AAE1CZZ9_9GAST|nr:hypothetical protein RRG08_012401 [Elysia crispata]